MLRLYVAGGAPNSSAALGNLRTIRPLLPDHVLEVVDVLKTPSRALADGIIVTPTLVRLSPPPQCRIVGDLSDRARVLGTLGIPEGD